jgi:hypothetical protein
MMIFIIPPSRHRCKVMSALKSADDTLKVVGPEGQLGWPRRPTGRFPSTRRRLLATNDQSSAQRPPAYPSKNTLALQSPKCSLDTAWLNKSVKDLSVMTTSVAAPTM